jgi:hypothetical protein
MGGTIEAYRRAVCFPKKESAYGTQILDADLATWIESNDFEPAKVEKTYRTDQNRINGTRGMTQRQLHTRTGMVPGKLDASVEVFTWLLGLGLGNITSSGSADPYTHIIKHPTLCSLYPASTSMVEGIVCAGLTGGYKLYKGMCLDKLTLEGDSRGEVKMTYSFKHDGTETAKGSFTFPTTVFAASYLIGGHLTSFKVYPNGSGALEVKDKILSWKINYDFGVVPTKAANNGVYVPKLKYSKGKPEVKIEFVYSGDKSDVVYGYSDADTLTTIDMTLDTGLVPARSINMLMNRCYIVAEENADDVEPTLSCKVDEIESIADTGPAIWTCKTGVAAYLT